jgi:hypothetical protein
LKRGGFVGSQRGADGGYRLSRSPDAITVGEVLRYVKGTIDSQHNKIREGENPFASLWSQVDAQISGIIDQTTFGELARRWQEQQKKTCPTGKSEIVLPGFPSRFPSTSSAFCRCCWSGTDSRSKKKDFLFSENSWRFNNGKLS